MRSVGVRSWGNLVYSKVKHSKSERNSRNHRYNRYTVTTSLGFISETVWFSNFDALRHATSPRLFFPIFESHSKMCIHFELTD